MNNVFGIGYRNQNMIRFEVFLLPTLKSVSKAEEVSFMMLAVGVKFVKNIETVENKQTINETAS